MKLTVVVKVNLQERHGQQAGKTASNNTCQAGLQIGLLCVATLWPECSSAESC
jgi:hypothetical protein